MEAIFVVLSDAPLMTVTAASLLRLQNSFSAQVVFIVKL
jgi:hypothetical protein